MDFLQLVWTEFPELQKVIRVGMLPVTLALSPLDLISWLLTMRKLKVNLNEFPWILRDVWLNQKPWSLACFVDGGPPVIGLASYIHETFEKRPQRKCPYLEQGAPRCFCNGVFGPSCLDKTRTSVLSLVLHVDEEYIPASHVDIDKYKHLTALDPLRLETGAAFDPLSVYHCGTHGRILTSTPKPSSTRKDSAEESSTCTSSVSHYTLREYLRSVSEYTDNTQLDEVFSVISARPPSSSSSFDLDDSLSEESWRKRPNES